MFISEKLAIPIFLRLGKAAAIQANYENGECTFSCPANWLDDRLKNRNLSFGDYHACAFACVGNPEPRIENEQKRHSGNLLKGSSIGTDHKPTGVTYLYKHPSLLRSTNCFYHLSRRELDSFHIRRRGSAHRLRAPQATAFFMAGQEHCPRCSVTLET